MNIAGLDIATNTGLAVKIDGVVTAQSFRADPPKKFLDTQAKGFNAKRLGMAGRRFEDFLTCWLLEHEVGHVAIEEPLRTDIKRKRPVEANANAMFAGQAVKFEEVPGNMTSFFKIHGLEFIAISVCVRLNIEVEFVHQATWRKEFLGNGRPPNAKHEAMKKCKALGIECPNLDAAESVGILMWLDHKLNPYGKRANDLFAKSG